jgi:hypothetical protein
VKTNPPLAAKTLALNQKIIANAQTLTAGKILVSTKMIIAVILEMWEIINYQIQPVMNKNHFL